MTGRAFIPLLFVAVALLFFRGAAFQGKVEIPCNPNQWEPWSLHATPDEKAPPAINTDCALAYYPRRVIATRSIRQGDLPLWDPYSFTGQPFLANYQSSLLYPVNLLTYLLDPLKAMGWFLIIHMALAGIFAYVCARGFGMTTAGAAAAGLAFQLNAFFLTRVGHPTFLATGVWAPLVLFAAVRLARRPGRRSAVWLAAALALCAWAGFPQTAIHVFAMVAWFLVVACLPGGVGGRSGAGRVAVFGAVAITLACGLAAVQLLPTAELLRESTREQVSLDTFYSGTHHPAMLMRMIIPDFFGNPVQGNLWSTLFERGNGYYRQNYVSTINYFGLVPLIVGVYGILTCRRRLFFGGLFLLPLLVVLGTPLAALAWKIPGLTLSRPDRLILLPFLASSLGLGFGIDRLTAARGEGGGPRKILGTLFVLIALFAGGVALYYAPLVERLSLGRIPHAYAATTIIPSAWTAIVIALVAAGILFAKRGIGNRAFPWALGLLAAADLFLFGSRFHLDLPERSTFLEVPEIKRIRDEIGPYGRFVRYGSGGADLLPPGTPAIYGIHDVAGINALNPVRFRDLMNALEPGLYEKRRYLPLRRPASLESPILQLLGATPYTIDRSGRLIRHDGPTPLPRATLHYRWESTTPDNILEKLQRPDFNPADLLLLEGETPSPPLAPGAGVADITVYEPDRVVIETVTDSAAFLLLTDAWFPGWEARVNGERVKVHRADYAFRAVSLSAGKHVIEFSYRPFPFRAGMILSGGAVLLLFLLLGKDKRMKE